MVPLSSESPSDLKVFLRWTYANVAVKTKPVDEPFNCAFGVSVTARRFI
jgi:hypothetical protein